MGGAARFKPSAMFETLKKHFYMNVIRHLKEEPEGEEQWRTAAEDQCGPEEEDEPWVRCKNCFRAVTGQRSWITIQGRSVHHFFNPHGLLFEIGCFSNAPGCSTSGPFTAEFTWFEGCFWSPALCKQCRDHLGWKFISGQGSEFFGLILDKLLFA